MLEQKKNHATFLVWHREEYCLAFFFLNKNIRYQLLSKTVIKKVKKLNEKSKTAQLLSLFTKHCYGDVKAAGTPG